MAKFLFEIDIIYIYVYYAIFVSDEGKKKRGSRHEVQLHTNALEELLRDVIKHKDSWPFQEPVNADEVTIIYIISLYTTSLRLQKVCYLLFEDEEFDLNESYCSIERILFDRMESL